MANELKFAVLIDADNISEKYIKLILDEISIDGIATYKRIYGDWTSPQLGSWKSVLLDNSILPVQQYGYTSGKNSTDSAMIIDAMDILYSGHVDGFCIASSDSDFTRLAARLRESGMQVIGMGESKTPKPFITACNQFKYLDILYMKMAQSDKAPAKGEKPNNGALKEHANGKKDLKAAAPAIPDKPVPRTDLETIRTAVQTMVDEGSDEEGWIFSGVLGNRLAKRYPDFDVRNFGFSKFTPFIESLGLFEIKSTPTSGNKLLVYVRLKE